ncbi:uncharacterized protein [Chamaea fasciata]|uniref:uncharacterized protein n=1 Tax=Chamaea fasciata TaxID=190680 RepID=UPI003369FE14
MNPASLGVRMQIPGLPASLWTCVAELWPQPGLTVLTLCPAAALRAQAGARSKGPGSTALGKGLEMTSPALHPLLGAQHSPIPSLCVLRSQNPKSSPSSPSWCPAQPHSFSLCPPEPESQIQPFIPFWVPSTAPFLLCVSTEIRIPNLALHPHPGAQHSPLPSLCVLQSQNPKSGPSSPSWCPAQPHSFSLCPPEPGSQIRPFIPILVPSTAPFLLSLSSPEPESQIQPFIPILVPSTAPFLLSVSSGARIPNPALHPHPGAQHSPIPSLCVLRSQDPKSGPSSPSWCPAQPHSFSPCLLQSQDPKSSPSSPSWCPAQPHSFSLCPPEPGSQIQPFIPFWVPSTAPFLLCVSSGARIPNPALHPLLGAQHSPIPSLPVSSRARIPNPALHPHPGAQHSPLRLLPSIHPALLEGGRAFHGGEDFWGSLIS